MFKNSIDRVMISCLFHVAPQIMEILGRYKVLNQFYHVNNMYIIPESYAVVPISSCINKSIINFIDNKYEYLLINQSKYEIFCINNQLKKYLDNFQAPKTEKEVKRINYKLNCDYFKNLVQHGFIIKTKQSCNSAETTNVNSKLFRRFIFLKELASNYNSSTFLVKCKKSNNKYIMKIYNDCNIEANYCMNNEILAREIFKEYNFLPRLIEVDNNKKIILMEYIKGISVSDYLKEHPQMYNRINISKNIIKTMSIIHSKNYLHGDLHMGQFIVDHTGNIKLIDWEMLINLSSDILKEHSIQGGVFEYLAPETIQNDPFSPLLNTRQSFHSEVYRLGVILYKIIYNEFPFIGFTWNQLYNAIKTEKLGCDHTNLYHQYVPAYIIEIIKGCLNKKENSRFSSAKEITLINSIINDT